MRTPARLSLLAAGLLFAGSVFLHTKLVKAEPGIDATVTQVPAEVRLWFSEKPEAALTSAALMKEDHSPVATVRMKPTDDSLVVAGPVPVRPLLPVAGQRAVDDPGVHGPDRSRPQPAPGQLAGHRRLEKDIGRGRQPQHHLAPARQPVVDGEPAAAADGRKGAGREVEADEQDRRREGRARDRVRRRRCARALPCSGRRRGRPA